MAKKKNKIIEEFEIFIKEIPSLLNKLKANLNKSKLDFSLIEIDSVQSFYVKNFINPEKISYSLKELDDTFTAYMGTALLWHFGGNWNINTTKNTVDYGLAYIENYGGENYPSITLTPYNWAYFIKTKQFEDEKIAEIFDRRIKFHANNPEFVLKPIRELT